MNSFNIFFIFGINTSHVFFLFVGADSFAINPGRMGGHFLFPFLFLPTFLMSGMSAAHGGMSIVCTLVSYWRGTHSRLSHSCPPRPCSSWLVAASNRNGALMLIQLDQQTPAIVRSPRVHYHEACNLQGCDVMHFGGWALTFWRHCHMHLQGRAVSCLVKAGRDRKGD